MTGALRSGHAVRAATPRDAEAIARVYVETWRAAYPGMLADHVLVGMSEDRQRAYWRSVLVGGRDIVHVAEAGGGVVGFAAAGPARPFLPEAKGEIFTLYVLPDHQNRGLGRALLASSWAALAQRALVPMAVWVLSANPARFFYERLGGARAAERDSTLSGTAHRERGYLWRTAPCSGGDGSAI
ncbi:MAG: GNAT family N-acetyltransferase [Alphaproteobacteria bacterium]|nr:GNAT family N-acetyltransferase [Alphaproteobacteria bacterium]